MTSIAAYPKQLLPWLQAFLAPRQAKAALPLWQQGAAYQHAITALSAKIASVDGKASPSEIAAFGALFPAASSQYEKTRRLFERQTQDRSPALQYARQIRALGTDMEQRQALLGQFIQLANCDAPLNVAELELLRAIAKTWAIDADAFRVSVSRVLKSKSTSPFEVLGVNRHASDTVIRARYLEQVRYLHPDQFAGLNASPESVAILSERLADINAAYNQIARSRKGVKRGIPARRHGLEPTKGARS